MNRIDEQTNNDKWSILFAVFYFKKKNESKTKQEMLQYVFFSFTENANEMNISDLQSPRSLQFN